LVIRMVYIYLNAFLIIKQKLIIRQKEGVKMIVTKNVKEDMSRIEDKIANEVKEVLTRYVSEKAVIEMKKRDNGILILDRRNYLKGGTYPEGVGADVGRLDVSIFPKDNYITIQVELKFDYLPLPLETKYSDLKKLVNDLVKTIKEEADKFKEYDILIITLLSDNTPIKEGSVEEIRRS